MSRLSPVGLASSVWDDPRMLTPDDVHNVAFGKPPMGRRGYNEDHVDSFLDDVEATMRELYRRLSRYESVDAERPHP